MLLVDGRKLAPTPGIFAAFVSLGALTGWGIGVG